MSWVKVGISLSELYPQYSFLEQMSTFHWHIVDSQSFPLVVPGFTELSAKGAYSPASVYSSSDVKDIVQYAAAVSPFIQYSFMAFIDLRSAESM